MKKIIIVLFLLYSCTTSYKRENYSNDIKKAKIVCDNFLSVYISDESKAFQFLEGVDYNSYLSTAKKTDSLLGCVSKVTFLSGSSLVESKNNKVSGSYELTYKLVRKNKETKMVYYLELFGDSIKIVGSNENFNI